MADKAGRQQVILVCSECKEQNHFTDKNKKLHPDRMEVKKYCPHCRKTTIHREKK
jgi:large subunit ribosomal protein L33